MHEHAVPPLPPCDYFELESIEIRKSNKADKSNKLAPQQAPSKQRAPTAASLPSTFPSFPCRSSYSLLPSLSAQLAVKFGHATMSNVTLFHLCAPAHSPSPLSSCIFTTFQAITSAYREHVPSLPLPLLLPLPPALRCVTPIGSTSNAFDSNWNRDDAHQTLSLLCFLFCFYSP